MTEETKLETNKVCIEQDPSPDDPPAFAFIGVKGVMAWPEDKNGKEGYAVVYPSGYQSWCPKEEFEKYNVLAEAPVMAPMKHGNRLIRDSRHTLVNCVDEPGAGGACHKYMVQYGHNDRNGQACCLIEFQKGPIHEAGVNGMQIEDLLSICIDRLAGFQSGSYPCLENANALNACIAAKGFLDKRTADRQRRNVEGKSQA
ncbi:MAG TPA: hypothetical protein PKB02_02500 [Anaerohalosphaeraceae bacterium]|nr:hypothetical protein [Anaerohalosphaeraceae bacterium]